LLNNLNIIDFLYKYLKIYNLFILNKIIKIEHVFFLLFKLNKISNKKMIKKLLILTFLGISFQEEAKKSKVDCPVIGIDLGTTYSCVGIYKNGHVEIITNELGNRITPSVVAFTDEERLIGESAKNQAAINPTNTVYDVKRLVGRKYADKTV
jgi:hypothetical protein